MTSGSGRQQVARGGHDAAIANQRRVGYKLPPFLYQLSDEVGKTGVYFFQELQYSTTTPQCDIDSLAENLKSALQKIKSSEEYITMKEEIFTGYGHLRGFTAEPFKKLTSQGFKLRHLVTRSLGNCETSGCRATVPPAQVPPDGIDKRDQPEALIPMSMYTYAALHEEKYEQKSCICVISGDLDFASTIAGLMNRNHTVFAAVSEDSDPILG